MKQALLPSLADEASELGNEIKRRSAQKRKREVMSSSNPGFVGDEESSAHQSGSGLFKFLKRSRRKMKKVKSSIQKTRRNKNISRLRKRSNKSKNTSTKRRKSTKRRRRRTNQSKSRTTKRNYFNKFNF
jgi:hypothetical protein